MHEWRKRVPDAGVVSYAKARLNFLDAHKYVEELLAQLDTHSKAPLARDHNKFAGASADITSASSLERTLVKDKEDSFLVPTDDKFESFHIQSRAPWLTENLNRAQTHLFIAALNLHQAWVREAAALGPNLIALGKLLSKPDSFNEDVAPFVWQSLFMIVPAISTTLASVERMLPNIGESQFGNVIIEEAGQATPQSVAGILWRAKRALIIGDPMQIQPVVSAPEGLVRHLCSKYDVSNPLFSPLASSAQTLADESNELGAYLEHGSSGSWVGSPLRVHRRCDEPMFSISNTIAYGGLMTRQKDVLSRRHGELAHLPQSSWFNIEGDCTSKHWVPQQGTFACDIFSKLVVTFSDPQELDIFFITPFKTIKEKFAKLIAERVLLMGYTKEYAQNIQRRVGTVHTFQGKEADVVVFILGCDYNSQGAARWAGERPNLLNVAVTRARHRLYVVGSLALWHNQGFFSEAASSLPRAKISPE